MNPALINLIFFGVEEAIKVEPAIASMLQGLFSKGTVPTAQDWADLRASIQTPFATLAPDADAAADGTTPSSPTVPPATPA